MPRSFIPLALTLLLACGRQSPPPGWVSATSRDGTIALDLPATYRREGASDYWVSDPSGRSQRSLGLLRLSTSLNEPESAHGIPEPVSPWENGCGTEARATDVGCIVDRSRWQGELGGRHFVIETGLLEGASSTHSTVLSLRASWAWGDGDTVRLEGAVSDSAGLEELRHIAGTLRRAP